MEGQHKDLQVRHKNNFVITTFHKQIEDMERVTLSRRPYTPFKLNALSDNLYGQ